jgi:tRNA(Arg) A34 adenosine deaminase TadA
MSRRDARFVQLAAEESRKSSVAMQHGCVAVMHGKVVARSFNTTHRVSPTIWWSCHAEMDAIKQISCVPRERITLYIVRTNPHGNLQASAPCWHCMCAIQRCSRIKRIIYSESDGTITRCSPAEYCTQHVSFGLRNCGK